MTFYHQKRAINMTGQRFGRLVVVSRAPSDGAGRARWHCRCDCGAVVAYLRAVLMAGDAKSCGCLRREQARINGAIRHAAPSRHDAAALVSAWR